MYLRSALSTLPRIYALLILCSGLASPQMSSAAKNEDSIDGLSEVTFDDDVSDQEDESSTRYLELGLCIPRDRLEEVDFSPNFDDDWIRLDHAFEPDFELHNDVRYNQDSPKAACDGRDHGEVEEIEISNVQEQNFRGKPLVFEVPCDDERKFRLLNKKPRMKILRKGNRISTFPIRRRGDGKRSSMYSKARERKRRCTHCQAEETPQWRLGPSGPNTLCNACGLRYKMGKLVTNYRPAASPSFDSAKHSNFYRRLMREK